MKKILLFLTVILLWAGSSWGAITVTIGTGTSITSGTISDVTPYKSYWMDGQDQILFTAAELAAAGLGSGNIEKLAFNVGSANTSTLNSFTISMQQIPATTLTAFLTTGWTECFIGNVVAVLGWNTYTFTTPFAWDGTSSVVFKVCYNNTAYTNNSHVYYSAIPTGVHAYWYGDLSTTSGCDVTASTGLIARPNVQITGQPSALPMLSAIPSSLSFGYTTVGNPVPANPGLSYVLSGTNLAAGPIVVTAPAGFEVSPDGTTWVGTLNVTYTAPTLANTTIYVRFNPLAANTLYTGNVTNVGGGTNSNVAVSGSSSFFSLYCTSGAFYTSDEEITHVSFGDFLNNTTTCASLVGTQGTATGTADIYSNFVNSIAATNVNQGAIAPITVTVTECAGNPYGHEVRVYIDWNQNGLLTDPGEEFIIWAYASSNTHTINSNISIPMSATLGNTLMRVVCQEQVITGPCTVASWGETEDYRINVSPAQLGNLEGYVFDLEGGCTVPLNGVMVSNGTFSALTNPAGFYQLNGIAAGTYTFTASRTGYVSGTINGVVVTLGNTTTQDFCLAPDLVPPVALSATVSLNNVHVSWMPPGSLPAEQWIKWDNGTNTNSIGTGAAADFSVASRWPVADIAPYNGMFLKKIEFWPAVAGTSCTYTIKVWQGVTPPTEIYSFTIPAASITAGAWNTFTFPAGIAIDGSQEFWFGYEANTTTGYPAGCDAGPQVAGKGNMVQWGGVWTELTGLNPVLTFNWTIHGWLAQTATMGPQQMVSMEEGIQTAHVINEGTLVAANSQPGQLQTPSNILPAGNTANHDVMIQSLPMAPLAPLTSLTGYNLYRNTVKIQNNIPALFYDDLALPPGGYDYEVSAQYTFGESVKIGPVHVDVYSCFVPTNVQVPAATTTMTGAQVSWTPSLISLNPEWVYEYGPAGFAHGAGIGGIQYIDSPFLPLNGLTAGTEYDFYVATYCAAGDTSLWVKKTFRTHYLECPVGATAEAEPCGADLNGGCNMTVPAFEPIVCGETKCGTSYFDGSNRDTDWYEFTLATPATITWTGKAEFSFLLGIIAAPCPSTTFIASGIGAPGATITVTTTLAAGTYYAWAGPQFAEVAKCDSLNLYFATLTCNTDIVPPVITNVVSTPASCTAIAHTVTANITDDISVGTVNIVWTLNGVAQPNIPMALGVAPSYSGVIPAQGSGVVVFHISASDNATPVNTATSPFITYQDAYLAAVNLSAGTDQIKSVGSTATLNATYVQNASCLRITEITLYSTGNGTTVPYPAFMTTGTFEDLVEITNTGTVSTDLAGIHLKCEGLRVTDYTFPSAIVPPGGVVIVAFGTAANDIPNLYFSTGQIADVWSSGTSNGIWLTTSAGAIIDAVATNAWVFSVASGVTASDWSGTGASGLGGDAGSRLTGADLNNNTNWLTASVSPQNIGTLNAGVPITCSASTYTLTWSGGNLPAPVVANPIITPAFAAPGTYTFTATLTDGTCTVSDNMNVEVPVPVIPVAEFTVNNTAQTTGGAISTALFTDLSTNLPDTWLWTITGPGVVNFVNSTTAASQNPQVQFMAPGLYTVALTASNSVGSDTETKVDYISVSIGYCTSTATTAYDEEIYSVTVNGATNAYNCTTIAPGPGSVLNMYSNFTTLGSLTNIQQTATVSFTVLEDECDGATYYSNGCAIWIDYNQDGDFTDADEQVYVDAVTVISPRTIAGSFVVPATALLGVTQMRIIVAEGVAGAGLTPCLTYGYGETEDYLVTIAAAPLTKTLTVTAFLEGLYNGVGLNQAMDDLGPHFAPGIADQVTLELHNGGNYSNIVYSSGLVNLSTGGIVTVSDIPSNLSGSYYITIKHRNSIETTSGAPVSFAGGAINYNFTTAASQAYGSNLLGIGGAFVIYGGDVNLDGYVDTGDMNPVENASTAFTAGYVPEDANGDGFVDTSDMNIVENNSTAFVGIILP